MVSDSFDKVPRLDTFHDTQGLNALREGVLIAGELLREVSDPASHLDRQRRSGAHDLLFEALGGFAVLAGGNEASSVPVIDGYFGVIIGPKTKERPAIEESLSDEYGQTTRHGMRGLVIPTVHITKVFPNVFVGPRGESEAELFMRIRSRGEAMQQSGGWYKLPITPNIWTGACGRQITPRRQGLVS